MRYLKVKYYEHPPAMVMYHEAFVTFKIKGNRRKPSIKTKEGNFLADDEEYIIVDKKSLKINPDSSGLLKLLNLRMDEEKDLAYITIYNSPDCRREIYTVPLEEIEII